MSVVNWRTYDLELDMSGLKFSDRFKVAMCFLFNININVNSKANWFTWRATKRELFEEANNG